MQINTGYYHNNSVSSYTEALIFEETGASNLHTSHVPEGNLSTQNSTQPDHFRTFHSIRCNTRNFIQSFSSFLYSIKEFTMKNELSMKQEL